MGVLNIFKSKSKKALEYAEQQGIQAATAKCVRKVGDKEYYALFDGDDFPICTDEIDGVCVRIESNRYSIMSTADILDDLINDFTDFINKI